MFNEQEIKDLIITVFSISAISSISDIFSGGNWLLTFILSVVIISISLFVKLYTQKRVGKKYDCDVIYKFDYNLFIIALLLGIITNGGVILAAIGSISIMSGLYTRLGHKFVNISLREKGLISLSGPMSNVLLALASLLLYPINPTLFQLSLNLNVFIALFSLLPIPPLEGHNVFFWNRLTWFASFLIPLFLFFFGFSALFALFGIILLIILVFVLWEKMF